MPTLATAGCGGGSPGEPPGRDIGMCCVDACSYPPVLEDIFLDGAQLTKIVRDGLPEGVEAALEFTVTGSGAIRQ